MSFDRSVWIEEGRVERLSVRERERLAEGAPFWRLRHEVPVASMDPYAVRSILRPPHVHSSRLRGGGRPPGPEHDPCCGDI